MPGSSSDEYGPGGVGGSDGAGGACQLSLGEGAVGGAGAGAGGGGNGGSVILTYLATSCSL